jgi:hypothetical protein
MTYEQIGAGIIAAAVVAWPKIAAVGKLVLGKLPSTPLPAPTVSPVGYEDAIHNLARVRARLNTTGHLGEEKSPQRAAIDTLTLALVAGSDK